MAHVDSITLKNVKFKVSAKGRERVLKEKAKNVHAGVEGEWALDTSAPDTVGWRRVIYNPYKFSSFVDEQSLEPEKANELAFITIRGAFVK
jgi:hypothetical protein